MQAEQTSFLFGANAPFIEELYARYQSDPSRVDAEWRTFFEALAEDRNNVLAEVRGASWAPNGARVIDVPEAPAAANRNVKSNGAAAPAALAGKSEADIRAHCRKHLGRHQVPRKIFILKELPKTATGKLLKRELRKQGEIERGVKDL